MLVYVRFQTIYTAYSRGFANFFAIIPSAALLDGRPHAAAPPPSVLEPRPRFYFIMRIAAFHRVIARVGPLAFHR